MASDPLAAALGYTFRDPAGLERALTHRSYSNANNERLEFLGDALISLVVADALFTRHTRAAEGDLSRLRASLVREASLASIARRIDLGPMVRLGEGELRSGGWRRDSVLADTLEALIGAIHIDGGFEAARKVCLDLFEPLFAELPDPETLKDPKTRLQEWLQARGRPLPHYEVLSESGPPHRKVFSVRVWVDDAGPSAEATAASRRAGEQEAAASLLSALTAPKLEES